MPINVNEISSDMTVCSDDTPLSPEVVDQIIELGLERLDEQARLKKQSQRTMTLTRQAAPSIWYENET